MTDTMENVVDEITDVNDPTAEWSDLLTIYRTKIAQITELDALTEPEAGGRKALNDFLALDSNAEFVKQARQLIAAVNEAEETERLVLAAVLLSEGGPIFRPVRDKFVTENSKQTQKLPESEVAAIQAKREKIQKAATGLRDTLRAMIDDDEGLFKQVPQLPRKKSTSPATGKRIKGEFFFTVDGEPLRNEKNEHVSMKGSELAAALKVKTGSISALLEQQGLKPGDLPEAWEVTVNGKRVLAEVNPEKADAEDENDDSNEDASTEED